MGFVLGIAGPSASGKSTVAYRLAKDLGAHLISLDDLWIRGSDHPLVNGHPSYERPEQYDGAAGARAAHAARHAHPKRPVIIEGFLAFTYPEVVAACDRMVFVDVPEEVIVARRQARILQRGLPQAGSKDERVEAAWRHNGIIEWRRFGASQKGVPGVCVVDGTRPIDEVVAAAAAEIQDLRAALPAGVAA